MSLTLQLAGLLGIPLEHYCDQSYEIEFFKNYTSVIDAALASPLDFPEYTYEKKPLRKLPLGFGIGKESYCFPDVDDSTDRRMYPNPDVDDSTLQPSGSSPIPKEYWKNRASFCKPNVNIPMTKNGFLLRSVDHLYRVDKFLLMSLPLHEGDIKNNYHLYGLVLQKDEKRIKVVSGLKSKRPLSGYVGLSIRYCGEKYGTKKILLDNDKLHRLSRGVFNNMDNFESCEVSEIPLD